MRKKEGLKYLLSILVATLAFVSTCRRSTSFRVNIYTFTPVLLQVKGDGASVVLETCPNVYSLGYLVFAAAGLKQV